LRFLVFSLKEREGAGALRDNPNGWQMMKIRDESQENKDDDEKNE